jgi:hypothetical protein
MNSRLFRLILVPVVFAGIIASLTAAYVKAAPTVKTSNDPLVDIITDATGSACKITVGKRNGSVLEPISHRQCGPFTSAESKTVHLSFALAHHEPYVLLPVAGASSATWQQEALQLAQIAQAKRAAHRTAVVPNSCYDGGQNMYWEIDDSNVFGDYVMMDVYYYVTPGCTHLQNMSSKIKGVTSVNADYIRYYQYEECNPLCPATLNDGSFVGTNTIKRTFPWTVDPGHPFTWAYTSTNDGSGAEHYDTTGPLS